MYADIKSPQLAGKVNINEVLLFFESILMFWIIVYIFHNYQGII